MKDLKRTKLFKSTFRRKYFYLVWQKNQSFQSLNTNEGPGSCPTGTAAKSEDRLQKRVLEKNKKERSDPVRRAGGKRRTHKRRAV